MYLPVCRVCLTCDVSYSVNDGQLRETYERLAGAKLSSVDAMHVNLCYFCYWQLRKYCNFTAQARNSHKKLKEAVKYGAKVGLQYIQNLPKKCHLTISTIKTHSIDVCLKRKSSTNPLKKKVKSENLKYSLRSTMKPTSPSSPLGGNPELIIKKLKKPDRFEGEIVQKGNIEKERVHNDSNNLNPNKIQSTEKNLEDPQMIEEYLDVDYDRYDDDNDDEIYPGHEDKKIFVTEKYLAEHKKNDHIQKSSNLKETEIETQAICEKKDTRGFNQLGGKVYWPAAETSPDMGNHDMVAEFLELESESDLTTDLIVNQHNQVIVDQIEVNVEQQNTHNNKTERKTLSIENVSENCKNKIKKDTRSKNIYVKINRAPKLHSAALLENVTNELIYKCNFCKKLYTTKEKLDEHEQTHTRSIINDNGEVNSHTCNECGQKFFDTSHLAVHLRKHTNESPYTCEICGKSYKSKGYLYKHLNVHSKPKHVCKICNKSFKSKAYVYNYHMNTHFNIRPYVCHICKTAFRQGGALWQHIRTVHQGVRKYACDVCSLKFTYKSHLDRHMTTHSGIKAFSCDYCNMDFTTKGTMKRHVTVYCKMK